MGAVCSCDFDRLTLSATPFIEKNMDVLSRIVEDFNQEQAKHQYHQRQLQRQKSQQAAAMSKFVSAFGVATFNLSLAILSCIWGIERWLAKAVEIHTQFLARFALPLDLFVDASRFVDLSAND